MAEISKSGTPSLASLTTQVESISGLVAGEALGAFDACYIKDTDGKVYKSTGAAANPAAKVRGFAAQAVAAGEPITLYTNPRVRYGASLTPGAQYFLSGTTAGGIADAASTGGTGQIGFAVDAVRIQFNPSYY
jgi:hypothetical protein